MKKFWIIFLFIGFKGYMQSVKDTISGHHFKAEYGLVFPVGNLSQKIGIGHQIGFWYCKKIQHGDVLDLGVTLTLPKIEDKFKFQGKDSVFMVYSQKIHVQLASRFNKYFDGKQSQNKIRLVWSTSYGVSFFCFEDLENPEKSIKFYTDENGTKVLKMDTNTKALTSIYFGQGFGITSKRLGLQLSYNFTPYSWFSKKIDTNFGNSSIGLQIQYKLE